MEEFELIRRYFDRGEAASGVVTGIGDDGAVLQPTGGTEQIQVIDTLVEGVHFPPGSTAADIGYRAVAVNLSDIAAMGATPRWMTLALTLPHADAAWLEQFAAGLFDAANEHAVALVGGDTTSGPAVVVTVSISGEIAPGRALLRSGAAAGDSIYVSGTLGDAAGGLELLQNGSPDEVLSARFFRPTARLNLARQLSGRATAAIDLSDGLAGDLNKLLTASGVGGEIDLAELPLSEALRRRFAPRQQRRLAVAGGDDYELCFTASDASVAAIDGVTRIGRVTREPGLKCLLQGDVVDFDASGYRHFA